MGSPFYNKDKGKLREAYKTEKLNEVDLGTLKNKKSNDGYYGSALRNNVQQVLPTAPEMVKKNMKPESPKPAKPVKVDYIPPRPVKNPRKQIIKPIVRKPKLNPIVEAYVPAQFEGAKPLAQSSQKKIYSTFKEQMEQLKNK